MNAAQAAAELMGVSTPAGSLSEAASALASAGLPMTLDLAALDSKVRIAKTSRPDPEELAALAKRVTAGREKIAVAKTTNVDAAKIRAAERTLAELDDQLTAMMQAEARWYALSMAYSIGRDFLTTLHRASEGGTLTLHLPAAGQSFTLALDGPDDEPPF